MSRNKNEAAESAAIITRRGLVLGLLQVGVLGALGTRMATLQIDQAEEFRLLAEENRINIRLIPPARGLIYDRHGVILAENEPNYRVVLVREEAGDVDLVLDRLTRIVPIDGDDLARARKEIERLSPFVPVAVAERLTWEQFSEIAVNAPALPGISPEVGLSRVYPLDKDFAHIIGYVGPVSDYDLKKIEDDDPLLQIPRFQIGKTGVEARMERTLRGKAGTRRIEVNAAGRVMRELDRVEGEQGAAVQLTVDHALQNYVEARLTGESAAAVVIDVETGDLVAMASAPSFDPNKFVRGISVADYKALLDNKYRPLPNKATTGTYPPGSTFKMVTALAALEDGVIDPGERIFCGGSVELGDRRFHCWKRGGHGRMNLIDSLRESCDVYYYEIAQRVGIDKIAAMARKLGLGIRYDLPVLGVAEGLVPNKDWKKRVRDADWLIGDTLNSCIGQGFVLNSPLQLAVMTARLATGRAVTPRLVRSIEGVEEPGGAGEALDIPAAHLDAIRRAMFEVSNTRGGTAFRTRVIDPSVALAGKTGTSQVRNITAEERAAGVTRNEDLPWERRDHALFVGYAPYTKPKYAVSVVVEHGGGGSTAAAPIARDVLLQAQFGDLPPLEVYPENQREAIAEQRTALDLRPRQVPSPTRSRA